MATLKDYYTPSSSSDFYSFTGTNKSQSILITSDYTISEIRLKLKRAGTFTNSTYTVYLYATDINDLPIGSALATFGTFTVSSLTTSFVEYIFSDTTYSVTNGQEYAIVLYTEDSITSTFVAWETSTNSGYADGIAGKHNYLLDWQQVGAAYDRGFKLYSSTDVPIKPTNPTPSNGATEVDFSGFQLSWDDGGGADTFNVYVGETGSLTQVSSAQAGTTYTTDLAELETIFGQSPIAQVIYWRVDATNDGGTTTGDEWNFDARPGKASNPSPTDTATNQNLAQTLTWDAVEYTDTYSLYIDTGSGLSLEDDTLTSGTYSPNNFDYITSITWRVDTVNQFGTTQGDEWTFATIRFAPPGVTYFYNGEYYKLFPGGSHPADGGVEDTDYVVVTYLPNFIRTNSIVVACAANTFWYEDK